MRTVHVGAFSSIRPPNIRGLIHYTELRFNLPVYAKHPLVERPLYPTQLAPPCTVPVHAHTMRATSVFSVQYAIHAGKHTHLAVEGFVGQVSAVQTAVGHIDEGRT